MLVIGRALMSDPRVILLDEPSLGLAPMLVEEIFEIVQRLNREQKLTVLLVEQNATLALGIAEHGYVMENGRIVLEGRGGGAARERRHQGVLPRAHRGGRPQVLPRREALQAEKAVAELSVHAFTVYDMIARGAAVHGDAPAVIQGERTVSFRELQRRVDELAAGLAGPRDRRAASGSASSPRTTRPTSISTAPARARASSPTRSTGGSPGPRWSGWWSAPGRP